MLVDTTSKKAFTSFVNQVAFVKTKDEGGVSKKFVYLKKGDFVFFFNLIWLVTF